MPYTCRHGFGYSVFEHKESGISSELWVYVALDAPIKFSVLKVRNESGVSRRLSVTSYIALVLGEMRSKTRMHIITKIDPRTGALFARNPYNTDFPGRIVFLDVNEEVGSFSGDRTEFLGRNGNTASPAALERERLSNRVGAAMDPCAAMQVKIDLADKQEHEIVFTFGIGRDTNDARSLILLFAAQVQRAPRWRLFGATGTAPLAQCTWRPLIRPSTCLRTAGFSTRP